ncbi:MAG: NUDIX hydrolase [Rhodoluna sp.]|nr:NUDIX hydrolase [Rhodoluna sp.]
MTVYAAGAICWREDKGRLLVAVIHRARYNDWSWPKGKVDPGETLPETAVREILEETGLTIRLGMSLGIQKYPLSNGRDKEVHYWAAKVTTRALKASRFKPSEEVAKVDWLSPDEAALLLTYEHDKEFLEKLVMLHAQEQLDTKPFIVLRHGKATPRGDWSKGEESRPLLAPGKMQAKQLKQVLACWGPKRVVSSPWERCKATVAPYAMVRGIPVEYKDSLTESGNKEAPSNTLKVIHKLIQDGRSTVVCTHRPALPTVLEELAKYNPLEKLELLENAKGIKPGHFVVAHLTRQEPGKNRQIVSVETYGPLEAK